MLTTIKAYIYTLILRCYKYLGPVIRLIVPPKIRQFFVKDYRETATSILEQIDIGKHYISPELPKGVNVVGYVQNAFGLAQQAFSVGNPFLHLKVPMCYVDCSNFSSAHVLKELTVQNSISENNIYNCNILSCNGELFLPLYLNKSKKFFQGRYNIHYGAWELSKYPKEWVRVSGAIDEFWAMSRFVQKSVQDAMSVPVLLLPYSIDFQIPNNISRSDFNLPKDSFLFIFSYDFSSSTARKNPIAVLRAFVQAFPKNSDVGLVIKVSRDKTRSSHNNEMQELLEIASRDKRIYIIDTILTNEQMKGLINSCDVYVSLHRSEGFGMGMAEAMKMGKAVIATNYSGNTDFTNDKTACMVDYKLIPVKQEEYIFVMPEDVWADPIIEHASEHMKKLFTDSEFYKSISSEGKKIIDTEYNYKVVGQRFVNRLKEVGVL